MGFPDHILQTTYEERREEALDSIRGIAGSLRPGEEMSIKAEGKDASDGTIFRVLIPLKGFRH